MCERISPNSRWVFALLGFGAEPTVVQAFVAAQFRWSGKESILVGLESYLPWGSLSLTRKRVIKPWGKSISTRSSLCRGNPQGESCQKATGNTALQLHPFRTLM